MREMQVRDVTESNDTSPEMSGVDERMAIDGGKDFGE
jgi:hypothetical protein